VFFNAMPYDSKDSHQQVEVIEPVEIFDDKLFSADVDNTPVAVKQSHGELYLEAMRRYPNDAAIDSLEEKRLVRKLDRRIIPLLGVCYFFYVSMTCTEGYSV